MMRKWLWILPLLVLTAGCASGLGSGDYERREARQAYSVRMGVVTHVRPVRIEGTESGVGTLTGGVVGGIAGSNVGGGKGQIIGTVLGALAGSMAGAAAEESLTRRPGVEVTVRLDSGRTIAVVQEDTGEQFLVGDRVRVIKSGRTVRVTH